jgi:coproporphyrinogen III oxidase
VVRRYARFFYYLHPYRIDMSSDSRLKLGGSDLTPSYLFEEDARHFHDVIKVEFDATEFLSFSA